MRNLSALPKIIKTTYLAGVSPTPASFVYFITMRCNARCKMCQWWREVYGEKSPKRTELSLEQINAFSNSAGHQVKIEVTGGEPFLREDIEEALLILARNCKPVIFTISTNGSLTKRILRATEALCRALPGSQLRINVSLDGIEEEHDAIRSIPGLYQKAKTTIQELHSLQKTYSNLTANITTVLSTYNFSKILPTLELLRAEMNPDHLGIMLARGHTPSQEAKDVTIDQYDEILKQNRVFTVKQNANPRLLFRIGQALEQVLTNVILNNARQQRQTIPCLAGRKHILIMDDGVIVPCDVLGPYIEEHPCAALQSPVMAKLEDYDFSIPKAMTSLQAQKVQSFIKAGGCWCTSDCGFMPSITLNPRLYPRIGWAVTREMINALFAKR